MKMKNDQLIITQGTEVQDKFKWRDRKGVFHYPHEMETKHLFFTLRMIWNHAVPERMRIHPYTHYTFNSFYTSAYMGQAISVMLPELLQRKDMAPYFIRCLQRMQSHCDEFFQVKRITN